MAAIGSGSNPVAILNTFYPKLPYVFRDPIGPPHNRVFFCSVTVEERVYSGHGSSKKAAKQAAAQEALKELHNMRLRLSYGSQCTADDVLSENFVENETERSTLRVEEEGEREEEVEREEEGQGEGQGEDSDESAAKRARTGPPPTLATPTHPVSILMESFPTTEFTEKSQKGPSHKPTFEYSVKVQGWEFTGSGGNKKDAKLSAAQNALEFLARQGYLRHKPHLLRAIGVPELGEVARQPLQDAAMNDMTISKINNFITKTAFRLSEEVQCGQPKVTAALIMLQTKVSPWQPLVASLSPLGAGDQIIAIATGTKCISGIHLSEGGYALNDCHAEVVIRRAFMHFMYHQLELHKENKGGQSILEKLENGKFSVRRGITFHLYISTSPCGDGRVFSPNEEAAHAPDQHPGRANRGLSRAKIEAGEGTVLVPPNIVQTWDGILQSERLYTMSCSDKISRWNILGIQGALLSLYMEPVYLDSIIVGSLFSKDHLSRALNDRIASLQGIPQPFAPHLPNLYGSSGESSRNLQKTPNISANWIFGVGDDEGEVIHCPTGKKRSLAPSRLCKTSLFETFLSLWDHLATPDLHQAAAAKIAEKEAVAKQQKCLLLPGNLLTEPLPFSDAANEDSEGHHSKENDTLPTTATISRNVLCSKLTYGEVKELAEEYQLSKLKFIEHFRSNFGGWVEKPDDQDSFRVP